MTGNGKTQFILKGRAQVFYFEEICLKLYSYAEKFIQSFL